MNCIFLFTCKSYFGKTMRMAVVVNKENNGKQFRSEIVAE